MAAKENARCNCKLIIQVFWVPCWLQVPAMLGRRNSQAPWLRSYALRIAFEIKSFRSQCRTHNSKWWLIWNFRASTIFWSNGTMCFRERRMTKSNYAKKRLRKKKLESALWWKGQVRFSSRKITREKNQVNWKRVVCLVSVQLIVG